MGRTKRLKELTIKDNFMFGAVMMDEDNCKGLLERVLEIQIDRVDVSKEKSIVYHPEYKGCKLCLNGMPVPLLRNCYSIFNGTKYR